MMTRSARLPSIRCPRNRGRYILARSADGNLESQDRFVLPVVPPPIRRPRSGIGRRADLVLRAPVSCHRRAGQYAGRGRWECHRHVVFPESSVGADTQLALGYSADWPRNAPRSERASVMDRTEVLGAGLRRGRVNGEASNFAVEQAAARICSLAAAHRGVSRQCSRRT